MPIKAMKEYGVLLVLLVALAGMIAVLSSCDSGSGGPIQTPPVELAAVAITPANQSIVLGTTQQFTATGTYSDKTTQDLTTSVTWSSSNAGVATIDNLGLATAVAVGPTSIYATLGKITGLTALNVISPVVVVPPPSVPTGVTASAGNGKVVLNWNNVTGSVDGYNIYLATTSGVTKGNYSTLPDGKKIGIGPAPPYVYAVTSLSNGKTYYFVITAADFGYSGGGESAESIEVSATPMVGATLARTLDATNISDISATLNGDFENPSGETTAVWFSYGTTTTYGMSTSPVNYVPPGTFAPASMINALQEKTIYHYRLVTQNSDGIFYGDDMVFRTTMTPVVLASGQYRPGSIVVVPVSVYWIEFYPAMASPIHEVGINGGPVTTLASANSWYSRPDIAIDPWSVYWTEDGGGIGSGAARKYITTEGTVTTLAAGLSFPTSIAVDVKAVYWIENGSTVGTGSIKKIGINGEAVTTLATGLSNPYSLATDTQYVYWVEQGFINKVGIDGGTIAKIPYLGPNLINNIAVDDVSVYFTTSGYGHIYKVGKNGGTLTLLARGTNSYGDIAIDASHVYWAEEGFTAGSGAIKKVGINGGMVTTLAGGLNAPVGIAIDATSVYWTEGGTSGAVKKVPKNY